MLPESEQQMRRLWAREMLAHIRRDNVEARYRYHRLLNQLLEDYFALRGEMGGTGYDGSVRLCRWARLSDRRQWHNVSAFS